MPNMDDVYAALLKADAAGDKESAKVLADYIRSKQASADEIMAGVRPDYTVGEAFSKGVKRGFKQVGSAFGDVIPAMAGSALGFDDYAKRQMQEAADTQQDIAQNYAPQYGSFKDVHGIGDFGQYAVESVGEQFSNILTSLIPGVGVGAIAGRTAATTAAKALATQAAEKGLVGELAEQFVQQGLKTVAPQLAAKAQAGQAVGAFLGSYAQNAPEVFQNIYEQTGSLEPSVALLFGAASGALDSVLPARVVQKITGPMRVGIVEKILEKSGMNRGLLRKATSELITSTGMEGLTEGAQEAISLAAENFVDSNKGLFNDEGWNRIMESAIKGAVTGGVLGGTSGAVEGAREGMERGERLQQLKGQRAARDQENQRIEAYGGQMSLPGFEERAATPNETALGTPLPPPGELPPAPPPPPAPGDNTIAPAPATEPDNSKQLDMFGADGSLAPGGAKIDRENARFVTEASKKLAAEAAEKGLSGPDAIKYVQDNLPAEAARQQAEAQKIAEEKAKSAAPKSYEDIIGASVNQAAERQAKIDANKAREETKRKAQADKEAAKQAKDAEKQRAARINQLLNAEQIPLDFGPPRPDETTVDPAAAAAGQQDLFSAPVAPTVQEVAPAESPTVITGELLKPLSIFRTAKVLKEIVGKDLANPQDAAFVRDKLEDHAHKTTNAKTRAAIEQFLKRPEFNTTEKTDVSGNTGAVTGTSNAGLQGAKQPGRKRRTPAARTEGTDAGSVAATVPTTGSTNAGEAVQPGALNRPEISWSTPGAETPSIPGQDGVPATTMKVERTAPTPAERTAVLNEGWRQAAQENQTETTERPAPAASSRAVDAVRRGNMGEAVGHLENEAGGNQKAGPTGVLSTLRELAGTLRNMFSVTDDRSALIAADKKRVETDLGRDFTPAEELAHAKSIREAEDVYKKLQYMTSDKEGREKPNAVGRLLYKTNGAGTAFERDENGKKIPIYKQTTDKLVTAKRGFSNAKVVVEGNKGSEKDIARLRQEGKTAEYDPSTNTFYFTSAGLNDETILRVMTHAATVRVLWQYNNSPESLSPAQRSAAEHVTNIYNGVKRLNGTRNALQLKNVYSFVSYAMTNKPFQEYLGQLRSSEFPNIPFRMKLSNAWDTLLLAVARMIGVDKFAGLQNPLSTRVKAAQNMDNALLQVVDTLKDLLGSPNTELGINAKETEVTSPANPPRKKLGSAKLNAPVYEGKPLSAEGRKLVESGNVAAVLDHLIDNASPVVATVLRRIKSLGLTVKLRVGEVDENTAGNYDSSTNTITLDPKAGLTEHAVMHELVHAAIAHVLDKANHPLTKKFTAFFEQIQGRLGNTYGAQNLQEFAAELVSNPEFQSILKSIKAPKSENFFKRIAQSIAEFLGFGKNSLDAGTKFVNDILDISNDVEPSDGAKLFLSLSMQPFVNAARNMPAATQENLEAAKNTLSNLTGGALSKAAFGLLSLNNLYRMYGKDLPGIKPLMDAIEKRIGLQDAKRAAVKRNVNEFTKVRDAHPKEFERMSKMAIEARLTQVDILDPKFTPAPTQAAEYNRLRNELAALPKPVRDAYEKMRGDFDKEFNEYKKFLLGKVSNNPTLSAKLQLQFANLAGAVGYVPFKRYGDYWVEYPDPTTGERVATAFESVRERDQFVKTLTNVPKNSILLHKNMSDITYDSSNVPPTQFVGEIMLALKKQKVPQSVLDEVYRSYLMLFPGQSIVKQMVKSKNVLGMSQDLIRGYDSLMSSWANKLANSEYNPAVIEALDSIREDGSKAGNSNVTAAAENILAQKDFFLNPTNTALTKTFTTASYFEYIAGNISSAIVNLTALPMMAWPLLGGAHGMTRTTAAMTAAGKVALKDWSSDPKYAQLYKSMNEHGQLQHTAANDILDATDNLAAKIAKFVSIPFAASERYNRAVTAIAAYDLAMANGVNGKKVTQQEAIDYALGITKDIHTSGMIATAPRWMQTGIGRVFFTFKQFTWNSAFVMARAWHQAFKGETPQLRKEAAKQLLGTYSMAMVFAGAKGLPFMGAAATMASMLQALMGDDDEPWDPNDAVRDFTGELAYKGLFNYLTNLEVANRVAIANDLVFRDDPRGIAENGYALSAMQQAFGPFGSYAVNAERGIKAMADGQVMRGVESVVPSFVRSAFKGLRFFREGATTLKGDPIDADINAWNVTMQAFGFAPADLTTTYERLQSAKKYEREILQRRTKILNLSEMARVSGDDDMLQEARDMRQAFNDKVPGKLRITSESVDRSMRARKAAEQSMLHGVRFNKNLEATIAEKFDLDDED